MTERKLDPRSDAARSDPKTADENREKLKKEAEQQVRKAADHPGNEKDG